ncbi:uncharacterized protein LOC110848703 [Folsomia candida]|uniref:Secreted protein n=1 Tax=Folsomia candida TaxID=158441 RepID=A0A226EEB7_FOLCA|nr:uncharacterized protein LOC110848703 [Folsomia candida]OXA55770.1 hypothetical protein Fcan01_10013 [Folsomia candida]
MKVLFGCLLVVVGTLLHTNAVVISEEEQMALEISGVMLPPKKLTKTIGEHLRAIRKFYPQMERIQHRPKWIPGELLLAADASAVQKLNSSRYGPVKTAEKVTGEEDSSSTFHVIFDKPYHPARLVERVQSELAIQEVEGNLIFGDGNDITYHPTAPTYATYTFKMGWGDCSSGCIYKHFWEFSVAPSEETVTVKLEKEYGSDLNNREFVKP